MQECIHSQLRDELQWESRRCARFAAAAVSKLPLLTTHGGPASSVCLARLMLHGVCTSRQRMLCPACHHWHCSKSAFAAFVLGCWRQELQKSGIGDHYVWLSAQGSDNRLIIERLIMSSDSASIKRLCHLAGIVVEAFHQQRFRGITSLRSAAWSWHLRH
eukprot:6479254-Amphidinium_carterae.1